MANNIDITAGTGTTVASDDIAGVHYQVVKLASGGEDSADRIGGDTANGLDVDVTRLPTAIVASAAMVAHDAVDAGDPVKIGAKAKTSPAAATMVADGDRTNLYADVDGMQMVKLNTSFSDILTERLTDTAGASFASTVFDATASTRNYITSIVLYNSSTANSFVDVRDGTAGAVILTLPLPAQGGVIFNPTVPLKQPTANTALAFDVSAGITTVYISLIGFKSKV